MRRRRRGGEGRGGVVARCVVERRRSVHGRIRIVWSVPYPGRLGTAISKSVRGGPVRLYHHDY